MSNDVRKYAMTVMLSMIGVCTLSLCGFSALKVGAFNKASQEVIVDTEKNPNANEENSTDDTTADTADVAVVNDEITENDKTTDNSVEGDITTEEAVTSEESTDETDVNDATTEEVTNTDAPDSENPGSNVYDEPETCLPPVADVKGNDWFDTAKFEYIEPVYDSYFDDTLFIGDSRTEGLYIYGGQLNMNAFCYKGLSVNKIDEEKCVELDGKKYTVAEALKLTHYDNYYIQFGVNELGWIYEDVFADEVSELADLIFEQNPDAVIYVFSIVPVTKEISKTDDIYNMGNVERLDKALKTMIENRGDIIYLDVAAAVSDSDGYLPAEATVDGKHCNADYCKRMLKYIRLHAVKRI